MNEKEKEFNEKNREAIERLVGFASREHEKNVEIGTEEKFTLQPAAGRIAIKLKDIERETKTGIVLISDSHAPKPVVGTVVAVCKSYDHDNVEYEPLYPVGSIVIFGKYVGTRLQVGRETYIILNEGNILAQLLPPGQGEGPAVSPERVRVRDYTETEQEAEDAVDELNAPNL